MTAAALSDSAVVPDHLRPVLEGLRSFLTKEVFPLQDEYWRVVESGGKYGSDGRFKPELREMMRHVRETSAKAGFYGMLLPEIFGGANLGHEAFFLTWELIYRECGGSNPLGYQSVAHWSRGVSHLLAHGTPELREAVLPDLMSGRETICFAMSEPEAGSDTWAMRTEAAPQPDGTWIINGLKQWITNGPLAEHVLVFAVTDRDLFRARRGGITAFLVPTTSQGFCVDSVIRMFGEAGGDEGILSFTNVIATNQMIVGKVHGGLELAFEGVSTGRLYNAARAVGLGRWSLARAVEYAQTRTTFGTPIISNQGVSFPLVDATIRLQGAMLIGRQCAQMLDSGTASRDHLNIAKLCATEASIAAIDTAIQTLGAIGFTNEVHLFEAWVQVRKICVADGASSILRRSLAHALQTGRYRI